MFYKKLDIEEFQKIQDKIVPYVLDFVTADIKAAEEKYSEQVFFNFVFDDDLEKFKRDIPELFECIRRELGSEITLMSFIYVTGPEQLPIHTDSDNNLERRTRLNWPILNGESAATIFYEKNSEDIPWVMHSYKSGISGRGFDPNHCHEVDRYILDVPTLMNVKQIHGIEILKDEFPRILLTMRLSNEEEVYQKYFN
jgi:hypothetical protein